MSAIQYYWRTYAITSGSVGGKYSFDSIDQAIRDANKNPTAVKLGYEVVVKDKHNVVHKQEAAKYKLNRKSRWDV